MNTMIRALCFWIFSKFPLNVRFALALREIAECERFGIVDLNAERRRRERAPAVMRIGG